MEGLAGQAAPKTAGDTRGVRGPRLRTVVGVLVIGVIFAVVARALSDEAGVGLTVGVVFVIAGVGSRVCVLNKERLGAILKPALVGPDSDRDSSKGWGNLDDPDAMRDWLLDQRKGQLEMRTSLRLWRALWLVFAIVAVAVFWWIDLALPYEPSIFDLVFAGFLVFLCLLGFLFSRARLQAMNADLQVMEYEILALSLDGKHERTAASLFFKHQFEVKRYYDQNLRQNAHVFVLGTLCVLAGLAAVAGAAAWIGLSEDRDGWTNAVAFLGAVGALLSGGVAAIYIQMHSRTGDALKEFHRRLVITNRLHFAYLLTAMDSDQSQRAALTAEIVKAACRDGEPSEPMIRASGTT